MWACLATEAWTAGAEPRLPSNAGVDEGENTFARWVWVDDDTPPQHCGGAELNKRQSCDANVCFEIPQESEARHHIWVTCRLWSRSGWSTPPTTTTTTNATTIATSSPNCTAGVQREVGHLGVKVALQRESSLFSFLFFLFCCCCFGEALSSSQSGPGWLKASVVLVGGLGWLSV